MDWPVICICNKARRVGHKGRGNELKYLWTFSCSQKYYIPSNTYTGIHKGKMADDLSFYNKLFINAFKNIYIGIKQNSRVRVYSQ